MTELRLLGTTDLQGSQPHRFRPVLTQPKVLGVLCYLTLARPRGFHRRDAVLGLLWPELGEHDLAAKTIGRALDLDPDHPPTLVVLGVQHAEQGKLEEAIAVLERAAAQPRGALATSLLARVYVLANQETKAREMLRRLEAMSRLDHLGIATVHAALGNETEAIDWLERGYRERTASMAWLGYVLQSRGERGRTLRELRSRPRFQHLLRRMNITQ